MKPRHKQDPRLGKGHAHKSKKDYKRRVKHSDEWGDHIDGQPHIKIKELTDKGGSIE